MKNILLLILLTYLTSYKSIENKIVGVYIMDNFPKSTITIKADSTFEFIQNYRNPYLLPLEHPDEYFFRTIGNWNIENNVLILNSTKDSLTYKLVTFENSDTSKNDYCNYVFYDIYNDTIPILFVNTPDGEVARENGSMQDFDWEKTKKDTLQFYFLGYRPITIINGENGITIEA